MYHWWVHAGSPGSVGFDQETRLPENHDMRPWQRAATSWVQAVMLLRWLIEAANVAAVARDVEASPATAYR